MFNDVVRRVVKLMAMKIGCTSLEVISSSVGLGIEVVEEAIRYLGEKGFSITSCGRDGYMFTDLDDLSKAQMYVEYLDTKIKFSITYVDTCDSTQDIAMELARSGAPEGMIVVAEELKHGRGRMGRRWIASRGGLWFSLILRPPTLKHITLISLSMALAVAKSIRSVLGIDAKIKWPNDVVVNDKKVSGILIEGVTGTASSLQHLVVGIGINVNNRLPLDLLESALTLRDVVGFEIPRIPLFLSVIENVDYVYSMIREGRFEEVLTMWRSLLTTLGRRVKVITVENVFTGVAEDVDIDGALKVRLENGSTKKFYVGDVVHLR